MRGAQRPTMFCRVITLPPELTPLPMRRSAATKGYAAPDEDSTFCPSRPTTLTLLSGRYRKECENNSLSLHRRLSGVLQGPIQEIVLDAPRIILHPGPSSPYCLRGTPLLEFITAEDRQELQQRGIPLTEIDRQLQLFANPPRPIRLDRPCTLQDGIVALDDAEDF